MMVDDANLRVVDGVARMRFPESWGLPAVVAAGVRAIEATAAQGVDSLLLDARGTSVRELGLSDRLDLVSAWGDAGRGRVRVGVLIRPEFFDAERSGYVWAARMGFGFRGFEDEAKALQWLRGGVG